MVYPLARPLGFQDYPKRTGETMRNNGVASRGEGRHSNSDGSKIGPFMLGMVVGAVVGGAIALLYAPAEGAELRKKMTDTFDDITEGAKDIITGVKSTAEKMFSEGRGRGEEIVDRTREKVDDILSDADRAIAEARRRSRSRDMEEDEG
jgi:gas vesicle protein